MRALLLLPALALCVQDAAWWNADWSHRRRLTVANVLDGPLTAGFPVAGDLDAALFGSAARADLADLVLLHDGKRVPCLVAASPQRGKKRIWFRLAADLPKKGRDDRYRLYHGNPAGAAETRPAEVFDVAEEFDREGLDPARWVVEGGLKVRIERGKLVIAEIPAEASERRPARLLLKAPLPAEGFAFSADLELAADPRGAFCAGVAVSMTPEDSEDPAAVKKVDGLVEKLGSEDLTVRQAALKDLIGAGRAALGRLKKALESGDPEVRNAAEQAILAIESAHPPAVIQTYVRHGDGMAAADTGVLRIGGKVAEREGAFSRPGTAALSVTREAAGDSTVFWNSSVAGTGSVPGRPREIALAFWRTGEWAAGSVSVDNVVLRRHLDEFWMPTVTLDAAEEKK